MFGQPLTNPWFPGGDGEKGPPVTATGAHIWPAMANAETASGIKPVALQLI